MKSAENSNKRVCFYLRNSTNAGGQDFIFQREALQSVFNTRNDLIFVGEYAEQVSGKLEDIEERPELSKLMQAVNNGDVDSVWVYDVKRLARNSIVLQTVCRDCAKVGVNVFFKEENINTLTPKGEQDAMAKMILNLLGEFAEQDRSAFIRKGIDGKKTSARAGNYVGGNLPCGYAFENAGIKSKFLPKKIFIDDKQRKIVEFVFDEIGNKKQSCNATAINLNNKKLIDSSFDTVMKSKNYGSKNNRWLFHSWAGGTVKSIINCTWYIKGEGYRIYDNEKIELDDSLTFIDSELWHRANEQLKKNQ